MIVARFNCVRGRTCILQVTYNSIYQLSHKLLRSNYAWSLEHNNFCIQSRYHIFSPTFMNGEWMNLWCNFGGPCTLVLIATEPPAPFCYSSIFSKLHFATAVNFLTIYQPLGGWGVLYTIVVYFVIYDSPETHPRIKAKEKAYIQDKTKISHINSHRKLVFWFFLIERNALF